MDKDHAPNRQIRLETVAPERRRIPDIVALPRLYIDADRRVKSEQRQRNKNRHGLNSRTTATLRTAGKGFNNGSEPADQQCDADDA